MSERRSLPLLPNLALSILAPFLAAGVAIVALPMGCTSACLVGSLVDALGLPQSMAIGVTFWLSSLPPTIAAVALLMGDLGGGGWVDATQQRFGFCWGEWEEGAGFVLASRVRAPPGREGQASLGGFRTEHPDRSLLVRDAVRAGLGGLCSSIALAVLVLLFWWQVEGNAPFEVVPMLIAAYAVLSVLPVVAAAVAWRAWWQTRRALSWTNQVVLEGNVLRTDRGEFHFRDPDWTAAIERDGAGATLTIVDREQTLRFRAPWADLVWIEQQVRKVRIAEGDARDVPEALRKLQQT